MGAAAGLRKLAILATVAMGASVGGCGGDGPSNGDHWDHPETLQTVFDSSPIIVRAVARGTRVSDPKVFERDGIAGRETVEDSVFELVSVYRGPTPERKFDVHNVVRRRVFEPRDGEPGTLVFDRPEFELGAEYVLFLREVEVGYPAAFYWSGPVAAAQVDGDRLTWVAPESYEKAFGDDAFGPSFDVGVAELESILGPAKLP